MPPFDRSTAAAAGLALATLFVPAAAFAQAPESERPPAPGQFEGTLLPAGSSILPEADERTYAQTRVETPGFTF